MGEKSKHRRENYADRNAFRWETITNNEVGIEFNRGGEPVEISVRTILNTKIICYQK